MSEIVKILWTGGWDSTYRIVELSRMDVTVEPYYLTSDRASEQLELQAMSRILEKLKQRPETKAEFREVQTVDSTAIPPDEKITQAYNRIHARTHLGSQHEWLARFAALNPGLELGTENGNPQTSHIIDAIETFGHLVKQGDTFVLDKETSTEDGNLVLGNFRFPIIDKYETDMLENIRQWGYEDVMSEIWFCHHPIGGKPCGLCHPCAVKMESNFEFLLPDEAQKRYRMQKRLKKIFGDRVGGAIIYRLYRRGKAARS